MSVAVYQIVCLQSKGACLYGELIQHVKDRQICWVRPISLHLTTETNIADTSDRVEILDVRNGPDIICADHVIHPVLDTDWLEILTTLSVDKSECDYPKANQHLRKFLRDLL